MSEFFRFPHTPHLAWLGTGEPRADKVLSEDEAHLLLSAPVIVEEKLDGANLGFSVGPGGQLRVQNRGHFLEAPFQGQFSRLSGWLSLHAATLIHALGQGEILFGEWCAAQHSCGYDALPDWLVAFDVYDRGAQRFWSVERRDALCATLGLAVVPALSRGHASLGMLTELVLSRTSRFGREPIEGLVIRRDDGPWLAQRAKLVRPGFNQAIEDHWRRHRLRWNRKG